MNKNRNTHWCLSCGVVSLMLWTVDGGWSSWSDWGECSETCGAGVEERFRRCDSPSPQFGGRLCRGVKSERRPCKLTDCQGEFCDISNSSHVCVLTEDRNLAINHVEIWGSYSATSNNMKFVHWLLHLVQRGGDWTGPQLAQALLAVPNVTAHPSTASVPITVLL